MAGPSTGEAAEGLGPGAGEGVVRAGHGEPVVDSDLGAWFYS